MIIGHLGSKTVSLDAGRWKCDDKLTEELLTAASLRHIRTLPAADPEPDQTLWNLVSEDFPLIQTDDDIEPAPFNPNVSY